jgi:cytochrome c oxidase subunit 3
MNADLARRQYTRELGLWMFLGTVTMLFAAFTSALVVRRSGLDWQQAALPPFLSANTAVLLLSSVAIEFARRARRPSPAARRGLATAGGLGLLFLAGQVGVWRQLSAAGVYVSTNPSSSFFYILTAVHATHLIAALVVLALVLRMTTQQRHAEAWPHLVGLAATFWHFLTATWLYLLSILSIA